ncbi:MAG: porin [Phycisphaerae bacterium]|jgi:phosphate-selective porin OprO/OprP
MVIRRFMMIGAPLMAVALLVAQPAAAQSDAPTQRERELEDLVRQLLGRVEQLEGRIGQLEGTRVQALENSVNQMKEERPPALDSDEWKQMRKWVTDSNTLRPYWKGGLRFDSADGRFKLKIGGRIQNDWAYFCEDGDIERAIGDDFDDGTEFRRARLYVSGSIYDNVDFKAQYDFADGDSDFKDVWMGLKKVPYVGHVRIGHFKEPFSLEELTSSKYITFLERSLVNTFAPSRNTGVMIHDTLLEDRMTWAAGVFRQTDDYGEGVGGRAYNATARITGLPLYADEGERLVHLGFGYSKQNYEDDEVRFRARPEAHLAPRLVDTGWIPADHGDLLSAEAAVVWGPLSLQGEYAHALIDGRSHRFGDPHLWAAAVQASYFLTGEHRPYKKSSGTFGNVKPNEDFGPDGGRGAWEVAARYSHLNLNDERVRGGRLRDLSLGLNWYLNPNMRMMWNYVLADPVDDGDVGIFLWRFQLAF